jgi:hypothetical protein
LTKRRKFVKFSDAGLRAEMNSICVKAAKRKSRRFTEPEVDYMTDAVAEFDERSNNLLPATDFVTPPARSHPARLVYRILTNFSSYGVPGGTFRPGREQIPAPRELFEDTCARIWEEERKASQLADEQELREMDAIAANLFPATPLK